jgi:hypothetical protein
MAKIFGRIARFENTQVVTFLSGFLFIQRFTLFQFTHKVKVFFDQLWKGESMDNRRDSIIAELKKNEEEIINF